MAPRIFAACAIPIIAAVMSAAHAQDHTALPAHSVPPFASRPSASDLHAEENRIWSESDDIDRRLRRQRLIHEDTDVAAYLQEMIETLYPEFGAALRVKVIDDPDLNAFALPNGAIYVTLGMLARLENESQLATVLAHEGAHFTHRHGYQHQLGAKSRSAVVITTGVLLAPLMGVANAASLASMYGFSRDMEREADRVGFERIARYGFDVEQSARVFSLLSDEAKLTKADRPVMFASHPHLTERVGNFQALIALHPRSSAPRTLTDRFETLMRPLRVLWLERALSRVRYASVIHVLTREDADARFPGHAGYFLGEAYRMRGDAGDAERAIESYVRASLASPRFAESFRALGVMRMKAGERAAAKHAFERYLFLAPTSIHAAFVKHYIQQMEDAQ